MHSYCRSAPDESVAMAGGERVEEHVQSEEYALQASVGFKGHGAFAEHAESVVG